MKIKVFVYASITILALAAGGLIGAAVLIDDNGTVDGVSCAKENPATPAAYCKFEKGHLARCRCMTRLEYATLARTWCSSNLDDPVCNDGYQKDLSAPEHGIKRFSINSRQANAVEIAADSSVIRVAPK